MTALSDKWAYEQADLFNPDKAEQALNEAVERVEQHANSVWMDYAMNAVKLIASHRAEFTTDPVWAILERWRRSDEGFETTHERRAMGAVMRNAVRAGWCVPTNRTQPSVRPVCHRRDLRIWASLICRSMTPDD